MFFRCGAFEMTESPILMCIPTVAAPCSTRRMRCLTMRVIIRDAAEVEVAADFKQPIVRNGKLVQGSAQPAASAHHNLANRD